MAKKEVRSRKTQASTSRTKSGAAGGRRAAQTAIDRLGGSESISVEPPVPVSQMSLAVRAGAEPKAQTVVYVHGIGNKPVASVLKCQWDRALFGAELGDKSRMAYWVNREYYPTPEAATCTDSDNVHIADDRVSSLSAMSASGDVDALAEADRATIEQEINMLASTPEEKALLTSLAARMETKIALPTGVSAADLRTKVLPLPRFLREIIARQLTRAFLRDVNDFLFRPERRKVMTDSLVERLSAGGGPFVIVAHSQGTMIAYEVLRQLDPDKVKVPLFVTIGSPLGLQEVQDVFRKWTGDATLKAPGCVARWVNVADRLDPVAFDPDISNDFESDPKIENHAAFGLNQDSPRHPHSGTGYLATKEVRRPVLDTLGNSFAQAIGRFVISRDLAERLEDARPEQALATLIQLNTDPLPGDDSVADLKALGERLVEEIRTLVKASGADNRRSPERLKRFVSADLTRNEAEILRTRHADLKISHIWADAAKRALIHQSTHTVQANPANLGYGATGKGIGWAVLDTGIRGDHPHFQKYGNLGPQWDCTLDGEPAKREPSSNEWKVLDNHGHGTHVAATIAGTLTVKSRKPRDDEEPDTIPSLQMSGMAPEAKLYGFKVLDDNGNGQDSYIIKALDQIANLNENSSSLIIHGVNLSLGGNFDPRVYGVGHTPLCQELRRLWRQGVIVCLAAGNEGWALVQEQNGFMPTNRDLSIGDPANLEEAIAVGSVHKENPHTFGISYFSSRGPTADGRQKPDVVAPGERILSALHDWKDQKEAILEDLYVEMSGTSMATPHVSGICAAFLSVRREFIGYPDRVKEMLLGSCTDLRRDRYMQGAGLPNLIRMLSSN
ncbi:S8 family serine peptidase [Ensifer sp. ENS04]|uniref:S8 family peptidase n=1 Tax=Ensifer sp. ENS04 TaxID=2769281 RepID=UPI0017832373|nr:S8 family peptidase [Ensifer sp. ENS04]MBD9541443.1 S8 family serine peptidase [Ensifer sp. ENS04]